MACCLLCASGCASIPPHPTPPPRLPLPAEEAAYYDYPSHAPKAVMRLLDQSRTVRRLLVQFPLSNPGGAFTEPMVEFEWFESTMPGPRPAILLSPILGGDYPIERGIARFFAEHGFHVALVHRRTLKVSPEHDLAHLERLLRQGVLRIRQIVDWMAACDRVDPERLGSFGISMGGIAGVMAAAVEPRLRVHVVALSGGGIADILVSSHDRLLTKPRQRYLQHHHISLETMHRLLQEQIRTDPIRLAPYVNRDRLLMFIALNDRTIGRANALRLWRALGRPQAVWFPLGHYTSYLFLPYLKRESLRFFQETLWQVTEKVHSGGFQ